MQNENYVIGIDYGTDSCRSVIINTANGKELASSVFYYPRWKEGKFCDPVNNMFRQHPLDYVEGVKSTVKEALKKCPAGTAQKVRGISIDTTGSTPVAVDKNGTPLALTDEFKDNPNAMFVLWKDHTAVKEADEINTLAASAKVDFTKFVGGIYSSEWFWAKILHILRVDEKVRKAAFSWVEHCDWMPALLTGNTDPLVLKRSRCAAGHKAMWHEAFGGLPSEEFLAKLDPLLAGLRDRLFKDTFTSDVSAGNLSKEWADELGLSTDVVVGVGAFDAHMGAVGGEITPYTLLKVMGTSTCDMLTAPAGEIGENVVKGICGQVDGSIVPGLIGLEAGQSAFGDIYAWFKKLLLWPVSTLESDSSFTKSEVEKIKTKLENDLLVSLEKEASKIPVEDSSILAIDWMNGRRTPDANQNLKGAIFGLNLGSDAPRIYRALIEATAFGSRSIAERFESEGVKINDVIAIGGVAKKSKFIMQTVSNVLNKKIRVAVSDQSVALGAAMFAAVAAGIYADVAEAQKNMGNGFECEYMPEPEKAKMYDAIYKKYQNA
ncbi:MAG: ribulokinase, partial [Spirochaetes bacterium]|nr:ribulokinase [Spirochaetota bacterium]